MDAAEEYVRSRWNEDAKVPCISHVTIVLNDPYWLKPHADEDGYEASCWQAAYEFTLAYEEKIRQVREEIAELQDDTSAYARGEYLGEVYRRILAREQAHLDSLLVGWKGK